MPPAVGLGIAGGGLLGSTVGGIIGSNKANRSAREARDAAQLSLNRAFANQPSFFQPNQQFQQDYLNTLLNFQANPQVFSREQERQAGNRLTDQFLRGADRQRQNLNESTASRGLFRSGVAAGQERELVQDQNRTLANQLSDQGLAFQQQRANEMARARALQLQALGQAGGFQQFLLGQQGNQFSQLLNFAQNQAAGAGAARQAANAATAQAIQGPFNTLTQAGLLGAFGGFGGGGAPAPSPILPSYQLPYGGFGVA